MERQGSKRAEILKELLPYINNGDYTEYEELIIFGASSFDEVLECLTRTPNEGNDHTLYKTVFQLLADHKVHDGKREMTMRLSLDQTPSLKSTARDALSRENPPLLRALEEGLPGAKAANEDAIDAAFAEELLQKLPEVVSRASSLDSMDIQRVPKPNLRRYFFEAHRCYLYGFTVASAVLCRAILETALEDACDPREIVKRSVPNNEYYETLVREAGRGGLGDDRPECAIKVRHAGNDAIHNFSRFEKLWEGKLGEIVDDTRKVLIDLYGSSATDI